MKTQREGNERDAEEENSCHHAANLEIIRKIWKIIRKMLENRPDDALGSLVETVETVETV